MVEQSGHPKFLCITRRGPVPPPAPPPTPPPPAPRQPSAPRGPGARARSPSGAPPVGPLPRAGRGHGAGPPPAPPRSSNELYGSWTNGASPILSCQNSFDRMHCLAELI